MSLLARRIPLNLPVFCLIIIGLASQRALADDLSIAPYIPDIVNISYGIDSDDGQNTYLYTNLGLLSSHRLILGIGGQDETVSRSEEELDTHTYLVGYNYYRSRDLQVGFDYENWGEQDKIITDTYSVSVSFSIDILSVSVSPQYRNITVYTDSQCSGDIDSEALKIDLSLYPSTSWSFSAGYVSYDYSKNRSRLLKCVDPDELYLIVARLQSVTYDNERALGFEYYHDTETYGLHWTQYESAIDGAITRGLNTYMSTDMLDNWSITIALGTQENIDDTTTEFLQGTLTYYW